MNIIYFIENEIEKIEKKVKIQGRLIFLIIELDVLKEPIKTEP